MPFDQRSLIHREAWFPPCFVSQISQKKLFFFCDFRPLPEKSSILRPLLSITFPKDSESQQILEIRLWSGKWGRKDV